MTRFVLKAITSALAVVATLGAADATAQTKYSAEIRRTSFGIPHIKASEYGSIGYGVAYAYSQDNFCVMADEFVTVRGERSRFFGPTGTTAYGTNNLNNDIFYAYFNGDAAVLTAGLNSMRTEVQAAFRGWVAGYNRYLRDTGVANLPQACRGQAWVRAIDEVDMMRLVRSLAIRTSSGNFIDAIANTRPPATSQAKDEEAWDGTFDPEFLRQWHEKNEKLGSNGLALGSDATDNRRGMLLGNPHFPWLGNLRFYQFHVTVPNQMDVMGGSLPGLPFVGLGFNKDVAWTYTVDKVNHFVFYQLRLDPASPLKYVYDGQVRDLTAKNVTVQVRQADGSLAPVTRTIYSSHLGPVVNVQAPILWGRTNAYVLADANLDNWRVGNYLFESGLSTSTVDLEAALERTLGLPWFNAIAADRNGNAFYADITPTWNVDRFLQSVCTPDVTMLGVFAQLGVPVLDGSKSSCLPVVDSAAPQAGLLPGKRMPRLHTQSYAQNSNDNYWLTNPEYQLYNYYVPAVVGIVPQQQNNRTRLGVAQVLARLSGADNLGGDKFTLAQLQQIALSNRSYAADIFMPDIVTLCNSAAAASAKSVCDALKAWDRKFDLASRGAHVFKEFMPLANAIPNVYTVPFDPANPLTTPRGLNVTNPTVATALVGAMTAAGKKITDAGLAIDAPLGTIQFAIQALLSGGQVIIPMHGNGSDVLGIYNKIDSSLVPGLGYIVSSGTSYIQTVQFTDSGVNAQAFLSMSQSSNPASPHFADQTSKFSAKQWITLPFTEAAITSDPAYRTSTISE